MLPRLSIATLSLAVLARVNSCGGDEPKPKSDAPPFAVDREGRDKMIADDVFFNQAKHGCIALTDTCEGERSTTRELLGRCFRGMPLREQDLARVRSEYPEASAGDIVWVHPGEDGAYETADDEIAWLYGDLEERWCPGKPLLP